MIDTERPAGNDASNTNSPELEGSVPQKLAMEHQALTTPVAVSALGMLVDTVYQCYGGVAFDLSESCAHETTSVAGSEDSTEFQGGGYLWGWHRAEARDQEEDEQSRESDSESECSSIPIPQEITTYEVNADHVSVDLTLDSIDSTMSMEWIHNHELLDVGSPGFGSKADHRVILEFEDGLGVYNGKGQPRSELGTSAIAVLSDLETDRLVGPPGSPRQQPPRGIVREGSQKSDSSGLSILDRSNPSSLGSSGKNSGPQEAPTGKKSRRMSFSWFLGSRTTMGAGDTSSKSAFFRNRRRSRGQKETKTSRRESQ